MCVLHTLEQCYTVLEGGMLQRMVETIVGLGVLCLSGFLLMYAYTMNTTRKDGYTLKAYVDQVGGLREGAPVCVGGVKVGAVESITLAREQFSACVLLRLWDSALQLPSDTKMTVESVSLLGGKYVSLNPGVESDALAPGSTINFASGSVSFESLLISAFMQKDAKS